MPPLKGLAKALLSIERLRRASTTLMRMPLLEEAKALPRGKGGLDIPFWRRVTDFNMPLCIREFDPEKEDWRDYFEQVEQYFVAHALNGDAKEPTKHTLFLSRVGSTTYATPKSLLAPAKPADKMFAVIISTLTKHYSPPPSEVVQSYRFFTRVSQPGETISAFVVALWRLARTATLAIPWSGYCRTKLFSALTMRSFRRSCWTSLQTGTRVG